MNLNTATMTILFYASAFVAVFATAMTITRLNAVHALLYLVVSLLAVAAVFFSLGAAFVAALEVIVYAGAIMVLLLFVVMMLNLGDASARQERDWLSPGAWAGPAVLALALIVPLFYALAFGPRVAQLGVAAVGPKAVSLSLFGPYLLGVELASMVLLAGLVAAYHTGRRREGTGTKEDEL
jgi:NADH-quinone oxidoreductase subunit J